MIEVDLTEEYEEMKNEIETLCKSWARRRGGEPDELIQESFFYFREAFYRFDGQQGDWKKWILYRMKMNLLDHARRLAVRGKFRKDYDMQAVLSFDNPDLLDQLSGKAELVAMLAINPPKKMKEEITRRRGALNSIRSIIRQHLMDLGWSAQEVRDVYQEIQEVLRDR